MFSTVFLQEHFRTCKCKWRVTNDFLFCSRQSYYQRVFLQERFVHSHYHFGNEVTGPPNRLVDSCRNTFSGEL